jgi:mono/diheme cytochrome c family protein
MRTRFAFFMLFVFIVMFRVAFPAETDIDINLARQGQGLLKTYCQKCHGDDLKYPGLDVTDRSTLLRPKDDAEEPFIVPGKVDESRLWEAVMSDYMPPEQQPQPSDIEKELFKRWIDEGAHFPPEDRQQRKFLGEQSILAMIADDLDRLPDDQVAYTRYFSLAHLWNDTNGKQPTTDADLRLVRAAVSKLVNSLSHKSRIVLPRIVDEQFGTLLAIDIRDYGWDDWHWNQVLTQYPYGIKVTGQEAVRIYRITGTNVPYIRADWFCATASRPPLYHTLLRIPTNAKALEETLGVNIAANFEASQLARAAFQKSGVSQQNRMVERHDTQRGGSYYWKSYDIKPGTGEKGDFIRRPLGPIFDGVTGRQLAAFEHDGGEIIWSLPNGLQAYMLVGGTDVRIDQGPPDVVYDPNQHGGSFLITNGISCMGCHRQGMINLPSDDVRPIYETQLGQKVADRVLALFPKSETMQQLVRRDSELFLRAVREATGPFLQVAEDKDKDIADFAEPVTRTARRYILNVDLVEAARELGLPATRAEAEPLGLRSQEDLSVLGEIRLFKELGLANWNNGGTISRENWEKAFGRVAREFKLGTPIRTR